jgi:hypothetical protein
MSAPDEPAFTAAERGDSHPAARNVGRLVVTAAVVVLVVGVILAGNILDVGRLLPWIEDEPELTTALSDSTPAPSATPAPGEVAPTPAVTPATPAEIVASHEEGLAALNRVAADDPQLAAAGIVILQPPQITYTLADLVARGAVRQDDATTFTLLAEVIVRGGSELAIDAPGATIRMASGSDGYASLIGWNGSLRLSGAEGAPATFVAWDEQVGAIDTNVDDGRSFIRVRDGSLTATNARFDSLGYWSGRTGGLAATATTLGLTAVALTNTEHVNMHYGLFLQAVSSGAVTNATISAPAMSGIELTGGTRNVAIDGATVEGAMGTGLLVERASGNIAVTNSRFAGALEWGVDLDGRPLAAGPSASGATTTRSSTVSITDTALEGNLFGGLRSRQMDALTVTRLTADSRPTAVRIDGPSIGLAVDDSDLASSEERGLLIDEGVAQAKVVNSTVSGKRIALEVVDSAVEVSRNALAVDAGHAVEVSSDARADIFDNVFVGAGQNSISVLGGARIAERDNDTAQWTPQIAAVVWLNEHPMMWMWAFVLVLPFLGLPLLARRRRKHVELRELLEAAIVRHGAAQLDGYQRSGVEAPEPIEDAPATAARTAPQYAPFDPLATPKPASAAAPSRPAPASARSAAAPVRPSGRPPRSFAELRSSGPLADRQFETLQQFAIAAVLEAGYPVSTIARLFRVPSWRLQQWVQEVVEPPVGQSPPRR